MVPTSGAAFTATPAFTSSRPGSSPAGPVPPDRRRGLPRDPLLAAVAMLLGGEALAPVRTRLVRPGDVLAAAGEPVRAVYAVLSGKVGVYDLVPRSATRIRQRLREVLVPGQRAREWELLSDSAEAPDTSVVALTSGLVAVIDGDLLRDWCSHPEVTMIVLRELARDTRELERRCERWTDLDVPGRLAALLLELNGASWTPGGTVLVAHGLSQTDLADLIGARRETVNRAGRQLEAEGLIAAGPRSTTLLDLLALAERAGRPAAVRSPSERAVS